jgi:hypothetical protein
MSPLRLGLRPRSSLEWANKSVEQPVDREEEDLLGKELDDALQGLDVPAVKQQDTVDALETGEDNITLPLSPLPPSSPLPPTSPLLLPSTDMEEFIDSDAFFSDSDGVLGDASELPPSSFSDWFSSDDDGGADMGELLTLDGSSGLDLEGSFSPNAFADMDFTEFWESLKPLLQASAGGKGETTVSTLELQRMWTLESLLRRYRYFLVGASCDIWTRVTLRDNSSSRSSSTKSRLSGKQMPEYSLESTLRGNRYI